MEMGWELGFRVSLWPGIHSFNACYTLSVHSVLFGLRVKNKTSRGALGLPGD